MNDSRSNLIRLSEDNRAASAKQAYAREVVRVLVETWGFEYQSLAPVAKDAIEDDFRSMVEEENWLEDDDLTSAACEYHQRIGTGNLASYSRCLA